MDQKVIKYLEMQAEILVASEKKNSELYEPSLKESKKWLLDSIHSLPPGRLERELFKYRSLYVKKFHRLVKGMRQACAVPVKHLAVPENSSQAPTLNMSVESDCAPTPYNLYNKSGICHALGAVMKHAEHMNEGDQTLAAQVLNLLAMIHDSTSVQEDKESRLKNWWRDKHGVASGSADAARAWESLAREATFLFNSSQPSPLDRLMRQTVLILSREVGSILLSEDCERASRLVKHSHHLLAYFHFKHCSLQECGSHDKKDSVYRHHMTALLSLYFDLNALMARASPSEASGLGRRSVSRACLLLEGRDHLMSLPLLMAEPTQADAPFLLPTLQQVIRNPPRVFSASSYCKYILVCRLARQVLQQTHYQELVALNKVSLKACPPCDLGSWMSEHWPDLATEILIHKQPGHLNSFLLQVASHDLCQRLRSCVTSLEYPYVSRRASSSFTGTREETEVATETCYILDTSSGSCDVIEQCTELEAADVFETSEADKGDSGMEVKMAIPPAVSEYPAERPSYCESNQVFVISDDSPESQDEEPADHNNSNFMSTDTSTSQNMEDGVMTTYPTSALGGAHQMMEFDSGRSIAAMNGGTCREVDSQAVICSAKTKDSEEPMNSKANHMQVIEVEMSDEIIKTVSAHREYGEGRDQDRKDKNLPENGRVHPWVTRISEQTCINEHPENLLGDTTRDGVPRKVTFDQDLPISPSGVKFEGDICKRKGSEKSSRRMGFEHGKESDRGMKGIDTGEDGSVENNLTLTDMHTKERSTSICIQEGVSEHDMADRMHKRILPTDEEPKREALWEEAQNAIIDASSLEEQIEGPHCDIPGEKAKDSKCLNGLDQISEGMSSICQRKHSFKSNSKETSPLKSIEIVSDSEDEPMQIRGNQWRIDRLRNLSHLGAVSLASLVSPPAAMLTFPKASTRLTRSRCSSHEAPLDDVLPTGSRGGDNTATTSWRAIGKTVSVALQGLRKDDQSQSSELASATGESVPKTEELPKGISPINTPSCEGSRGESGSVRCIHRKRVMKDVTHKTDHGSSPNKRPVHAKFKSPTFAEEKAQRTNSEDAEQCAKNDSTQRHIENCTNTLQDTESSSSHSSDLYSVIDRHGFKAQDQTDLSMEECDYARKASNTKSEKKLPNLGPNPRRSKRLSGVERVSISPVHVVPGAPKPVPDRHPRSDIKQSHSRRRLSYHQVSTHEYDREVRSRHTKSPQRTKSFRSKDGIGDHEQIQMLPRNSRKWTSSLQGLEPILSPTDTSCPIGPMQPQCRDDRKKDASKKVSHISLRRSPRRSSDLIRISSPVANLFYKSTAGSNKAPDNQRRWITSKHSSRKTKLECSPQKSDPSHVESSEKGTSPVQGKEVLESKIGLRNSPRKARSEHHDSLQETSVARQVISCDSEKTNTDRRIRRVSVRLLRSEEHDVSIDSPGRSSPRTRNSKGGSNKVQDNQRLGTKGKHSSQKTSLQHSPKETSSRHADSLQKPVSAPKLPTAGSKTHKAGHKSPSTGTTLRLSLRKASFEHFGSPQHTPSSQQSVSPMKGEQESNKTCRRASVRLSQKKLAGFVL